MKKVKIIVPLESRINQEDFTFKKDLTYSNIQDKLFELSDFGDYDSKVDCTSNDVEKLTIYRVLLEVANYLNDGWEPNWFSEAQPKYYIYKCFRANSFDIGTTDYCTSGQVCFKTVKLAKQAIDIIGESDLNILFS